MRNRHFLWIACCLAVGLSACATLQPQQLDTARACADWRWIGISRSEARCPEIPGWTVRPMFPQLAPARPPVCAGQAPEKTPKLEVIRELNRFCVYEVKHPKKWLKVPRFPPAASADLVRFDQDCAVLSLSERYLDAKAWEPGETFLAQAGKPKTLPLDNQQSVRLAFLDTQPSSEGVPTSQGHSPHGYTLARIAQQLVCTQEPKARCAAQITTRLALPILYFNAKKPKESYIDVKQGGYLGMQSDLAQAIRDEVDAWQENLATGGSQRHLVLNLSMAWDGELFGGLDNERIAEMRAGTQAVYFALQYATGFDALVLAAAGNQKVEPCENYGPLLPAAWEREAPREAACPGAEAEPKPLLYAVGGIDAGKERLANARPGGMPQRAAFGETGLFIGSSVATAIASSIAAVVWNSSPGLTSHEVMHVLDTRGESLSFKADFWFGSSAPLISQAPWVHKLSLCAALGLPCEGSGIAATFTKAKPAVESAALGSCQPWNFPQPEEHPCVACIPPEPPKP
jgi:hypothetical protein